MKYVFGLAGIAVMILIGILIYRSFNPIITVKDEIPMPKVSHINTANYTNILKTVHDDLGTYVGQKITCSGYVYKLPNFKENQFVLARDMIVGTDLQTVVVGFLCSSDKMRDFSEDTWVEITGEVIKGDYHGEIPVIKITDIKQTDKPANEFVFPPDENYVPTAKLY
jgi:putative membrane protein